jgi:hypothetical protein
MDRVLAYGYEFNSTKHVLRLDTMKRGVRENVGWGCTPVRSGLEVIAIQSARQFVMRPQ